MEIYSTLLTVSSNLDINFELSPWKCPFILKVIWMISSGLANMWHMSYESIPKDQISPVFWMRLQTHVLRSVQPLDSHCLDKPCVPSSIWDLLCLKSVWACTWLDTCWNKFDGLWLWFSLCINYLKCKAWIKIEICEAPGCLLQLRDITIT